MGAPPPEPLDPRIQKLIAYKARKLVGQFGFTVCDLPDLEQQLWLYVTEGLQRHDPARSCRYTFCDRIIASKVASILRHAGALKRNRGRVRSLEVTPSAWGRTAPDTRIQQELAFDVQQVLSCLPEDLRVLANLLGKYTPAEAGRMSGLTREQRRGKVKKLKQVFEAAGLAPPIRK